MGFWLEFCARGRGAECSPQSQACSKAWGLTHNPNSLSEIIFNCLTQVLLAAFWDFFTHLLPQGMIWSLLRWICTAGRGEGDVWMPYRRKGDEDQKGKVRKASTWASSPLNPTKNVIQSPWVHRTRAGLHLHHSSDRLGTQRVFLWSYENISQNLLLLHSK